MIKIKMKDLKSRDVTFAQTSEEWPCDQCFVQLISNDLVCFRPLLHSG
jgi:hypothetical protein